MLYTGQWNQVQNVVPKFVYSEKEFHEKVNCRRETRQETSLDRLKILINFHRLKLSQLFECITILWKSIDDLTVSELNNNLLFRKASETYASLIENILHGMRHTVLLLKISIKSVFLSKFQIFRWKVVLQSNPWERNHYEAIWSFSCLVLNTTLEISNN